MAGKTGTKELETDGSVRKRLGPSNCSSRDRAADAADAVQDMAVLMSRIDPDVVKRLVQARDSAAGVYQAFPDGDQRFASVESESEDDEALKQVENDIDGGWNEIEGDDEFTELCKGLLDDSMDPGPHACLLRVKKQYNFDIVHEMDAAQLDFFQRIRLLNHLRRKVSDGCDSLEAIQGVRRILGSKDTTVLENDELLEPFVKGDLILTVLESEGGVSSHNELDDDEIDAVRSSLQSSNIL